MKRKPILAVLLALTLVLSMMPTVAFAEGGTVDNAKTFSFIGGETKQADIDAAWGEGAVSYTSEEIDGETVYTIKLLKDINMAAGCDVRIGEYRENGPELPQMILDLNGCTINSSSIGLINYGDLIIRDTSEAKTGCIKYSTTSDRSSLVAISHKGGLLVIEDGNFICESGYAFTGYVAAVSTQAGAVTHIKGGTFTSNSSAVLSAGETVVYGGTFEAPYGMYAKSADGVPGTIEIPQESTAVVNASSFAFVIQRNGETDGKISASGGTYNAPNVVGGVGKPDTSSNVSINGGSYSKDPSGWVSDGTAVAKLTKKDDTESSFVVGEKEIGEVASKAEAGDKIEVLSGDVTLTGVAGDVEVVNSGNGSVNVNGEQVEKDETVTTCEHVWGTNPVWNWTGTQSAQATFSCTKNAAHTRTVSAAITSTVLKQPTYSEMGVTRYTASVVVDGQTYTDIKDAADIPALTLPTVKPIVVTDDHCTVTLSSYGTIATIKVEEGYELADVVLNGTSLGKVNQVTGLKTGDKLVVTTKEKIDEEAAKNERLKEGVRNTTIRLRSTLGNGFIRLDWEKSAGYKVDYYEVYKSTKRYSGYGTEPYFETKQGGLTGWYKNTKELKKGVRYYYKVRGVREIAGETVYTKWSTKAWRLVK